MADLVPTRPRVLALDDEPEILALLVEALTSEGYEVDTARSVAEFRDRDRAGAPDLYIVDVTLPDGNGFSVVRYLRARGARGIIMLTGRGSETDHVVGLELGADDYITKPFRLREMTARVNAVLRRTMAMTAPAGVPPQPPEPAPGDRAGEQVGERAEPGQAVRIDYRFDGYEVSVGARLVRDAAHEEVTLTTAEFNLLVALLRKRGTVLNRDQLMNALKGRDWESYDRAVDGLISRLRRKLPGPDGASSPIKTVHGVGYTFR